MQTSLIRSAGVSDGYLSFVMRYAVHQLYHIYLSVEDIQFCRNGVTLVPGRNPDYTEVTFTPPGAQLPTLFMAYAYGFRNIQNVVRKLKSKRGILHYVEVMACPSGCINGGGQLKSDQPGWLEQTLNTFQDDRLPVRDPFHAVLEQLYHQVGKEALHTTYQAVEKTISGLNVKW